MFKTDGNSSDISAELVNQSALIVSQAVRVKYIVLKGESMLPITQFCDLLSDSGIELVREELVEVILEIEGALGQPLPMYCSLNAVVWATQAEGSMGRTGSCLGTVKYPFGFGSQHLATTSVIGLQIIDFKEKINKNT